jgi:CubicO group peptidase (beta-lactamase class C family)
MTKNRCLVVLTGLLAGLSVLTGAAVSASSPTTKDVDAQTTRYLDELAERQHVPGLAAATVDETGTTQEYFLGEDGDGTRVDRDTPFLIGSVAKSMTATLVIQLVDGGRVRLAEPVSTYLDWLDERRPPTVAELLTHTSGYTALDGMRVSERFDNAPGALTRAAQDLGRTGTAGDYEYSSANYLLLGVVVEAVTGRRYAEVLEDDLLRPLGMEDTSASADEVDDLPPGHRVWWGQPRAYSPGFDESGAPFGYVVSTLADLQRYVAAQTRGAPDVLPRPLLSRMQTSHADDYGYGWRIRGDGDDRLVHHTGATPGYFAHVAMWADGVSVVLLANSYSEARAPALASAAEDLRDIARGEDPEPSSGDTLLLVAPWALGFAALAGLTLALVAWRRPRQRGARWTLAAGSVLAAGVLWLLPGILGIDLRVMRTWSPDSAIAVVGGTATWCLAAVILVLTGGSCHRATDSPGHATVCDEGWSQQAAALRS